MVDETPVCQEPGENEWDTLLGLAQQLGLGECRSSAGGDILQLAQDAALQCNQDDNSVEEVSDGGKLCIPVQRNNRQQEGLNSSKAISEGVRDAVGLMAPGGPWRWMPGTLHSKAGNHGATDMRCICLGWDLPH